jgi:hypothetical protein
MMSGSRFLQVDSGGLRMRRLGGGSSNLKERGEGLWWLLRGGRGELNWLNGGFFRGCPANEEK